MGPVGQPGGVIHDFGECLERSHGHADRAWWLDVYRKAFPSLVVCYDARGDGYWQRSGVDRLIVLKSTKVIKVDEKVREKDYGDILLERWSKLERKEPGWVQKPLECDYIAYAIAPARRCYLLPVLTLQRAWHECGREWIERYGVKNAQNRGYVTQNVSVPVDVLMRALVDAMVITWERTST